MSSVVSILSYRKQAEQPILILAGLHQSGQRDFSPFHEILANCTASLAAARAARMSVAFVRRMSPPPSISESPSYPAWIKGFEPTRDDMVFDVTKPSCYSNAEFSRTMDYSNGNFVIAGLFAETVCLSTAIDAYHRHHKFIYLCDASGPHSNGVIPVIQFRDSVSQIVSAYGTVMKATEWALTLTPNRRAK